MSFNLEVHLGRDVLTLADNIKFQHDWDLLERKQEKLSVLQGRAFVHTWYKHYSPTYKPVFFVGKDSSDRLIGVFPLAIHTEKKYLTCAGDEMAEYHGWLAEQKYEKDFLLACLKILKAEFASYELRFTYAAPGTRLDIFENKEFEQEDLHVLIEKVNDPLWNLEDPQKLKKISKRANVKRCYREFNARGNFRLEKIEGKDQMKSLLQEFGQQSDFKKEAIYNRKLFASDPHLEGFLTEMQDYPDINHFSVLWLDDKALGFNHALIDGTEMCLAGYTSYDPAESRNSPGKLHLIELAKTGKEEGLTRIDLTPGKDAYKSRFANDGREVHKLHIFFSKFKKTLFLWKRRNKELGIDMLNKLNIHEKELKIQLEDVAMHMAWVLKSGPRVWMNFLKNLFYESHTYEAWLHSYGGAQKTPISQNVDGLVKKNDYHDLLVYDDKEGEVSRREFLQEALYRFGRGDDLYTLFHGEELMCLAWVRNGKYALTLPGSDYEHQFLPESRVVYGFTRLHKDCKKSHGEKLMEHIIEENLSKEVRQLYLCDKDAANIYLRLQKHYGFQRAFKHKHSKLFRFFSSNTHQNYKVHVEPAPIPASNNSQKKRSSRRQKPKPSKNAAEAEVVS